MYSLIRLYSFMTYATEYQGCIYQASSGTGGVLVFDIRTGTVPQLGTITWWVVARSVGVCIREGRQGEG